MRVILFCIFSYVAAGADILGLEVVEIAYTTNNLGTVSFFVEVHNNGSQWIFNPIIEIKPLKGGEVVKRHYGAIKSPEGFEVGTDPEMLCEQEREALLRCLLSVFG